MKCAHCGKEISNIGYFSTFRGYGRQDYHSECKPIFIWFKKDETPERDKKYVEIINGKECL